MGVAEGAAAPVDVFFGRRAAAAAAATILVLDLVLVISGAPAKRRRIQEQRRLLIASVAGLPAELSELQQDSDEGRQAIFEAMGALDEVLNKGRKSGEIPAAVEIFPKASGLMGDARRARSELAGISLKIVSRSKSGITDVKKVAGLVGEDDLLYLETLEQALPVMIETQAAYIEMNSSLEGGMGLYEELFKRAEDFVKKVQGGFFRNRNEGASWFTIRTEDLVPEIQNFKQNLEGLVLRAQDAAGRATEAFRRVGEAAAR